MLHFIFSSQYYRHLFWSEFERNSIEKVLNGRQFFIGEMGQIFKCSPSGWSVAKLLDIHVMLQQANCWDMTMRPETANPEPLVSLHPTAVDCGDNYLRSSWQQWSCHCLGIWNTHQTDALLNRRHGLCNIDQILSSELIFRTSHVSYRWLYFRLIGSVYWECFNFRLQMF